MAKEQNRNTKSVISKNQGIGNDLPHPTAANTSKWCLTCHHPLGKVFLAGQLDPGQPPRARQFFKTYLVIHNNSRIIILPGCHTYHNVVIDPT